MCTKQWILRSNVIYSRITIIFSEKKTVCLISIQKFCANQNELKVARNLVMIMEQPKSKMFYSFNIINLVFQNTDEKLPQ